MFNQARIIVPRIPNRLADFPDFYRFGRIRSDAIRNLIWNYGAGEATTIRAFRQRYTWADAVFSEAKKEFADYLKRQAELKRKMEALVEQSATDLVGDLDQRNA